MHLWDEVQRTFGFITIVIIVVAEHGRVESTAIAREKTRSCLTDVSGVSGCSTFIKQLDALA